MKFSIRILYLYLFSLVGLLIIVFGSVQLVELGLKTFVFKNADTYISYPIAKLPDNQIQPSDEEMEAYQKKEQRNQRERQMSNALAMILVGMPLYLYHWKTIQKENPIPQTI